jgi:hypothetical protein
MLLGCGCLLAMGAAVAPRLVLVFMWIFGPRVNAAFNSFVVPLLGLIFLPYTTIMYVLVWSPGIGLAGWDWIWVLMGVALDIMKWGQIYNKRKEVPGRAKKEPVLPDYGSADYEAGHTVDSETEAELEKLEDLRDKGVITGEEYLAKKRQLEGLE